MPFDISQVFFTPVDKSFILDESIYNSAQYALSLLFFPNDLSEIENADIILLGCNEYRGSENIHSSNIHTQNIRKEFYKLYNWHHHIKVVDLGNIQLGENLQDSYMAIQQLVGELIGNHKKVILFGGSADLMKPMYRIFEQKKQPAHIVYTHSTLPFEENIYKHEEQFMHELLTKNDNFVGQYAHLGFQTFLVHPQLMEVLESFRADLFRLGHVEEYLEEMEPLFRLAHIMSFNLQSVKPLSYGMHQSSPHGLDSKHLCRLMQFAGMSFHSNITHICGYDASIDQENFYAMLAAQMVWYFIDGYARGRNDILPTKNLDKITDYFHSFEVSLDNEEMIFLESLSSYRWWVQLPNKQYIPCTLKDYQTATRNELPERWLRAVERL